MTMYLKSVKRVRTKRHRCTDKCDLYLLLENDTKSYIENKRKGNIKVCKELAKGIGLYTQLKIEF